MYIVNSHHRNPVLSNTLRRGVGFLVPTLKMCEEVERVSVISSHQWFPDLGAVPYHQTIGVGMRRGQLGQGSAADSMALGQELF